MPVPTITSKGQVTIPKELRERYGLLPGTQVAFEERDGEVVLRAQRLIDADQAWFWTPEWQEGMREAEEDVRQGRVSRWYDDPDDLIADLEKATEHD